jgi:Flp pilus assembly pilin Flp
MPHIPPTHFRTAADEQGQTLAEYGLLLALIAIVIAFVLPTVEGPLHNVFTAAAAAFGG